MHQQQPSAPNGINPDSLNEILRLHYLHTIYGSFDTFDPDLRDLLYLGGRLPDIEKLTQSLGIIEPLTNAYIPPDEIRFEGKNYRESLIANGLLSRNRGVLVVLESIYESLETLNKKRIYLAEAVTGFSFWMRRHLGKHIICSEYLHDTSLSDDILHQDLCDLTFENESFDLVLCNELFEHVFDIQAALKEIARVLSPGGRLVATFPLAFGQLQTIQKARFDTHLQELFLDEEPDYHGDPIRPNEGSLVYRIPGWDILDEAVSSGFSHAVFHLVCSWKHGAMGSDIPGILVMDAQR